MKNIIRRKDYHNLHINEQYNISNLVSFSNGKTVLLFHPLTGHSLMLKEDLWDAIESGECSQGILLKLIQRDFFKQEFHMHIDEKAKPVFFLINMTDTCNLHCKYCFRDVHNVSIPNITDEEIRNIANYIIRYCQEQHVNDITIQPWGGEPLIAYKQILFLDEILKKSGLRYQIVFTTNATLITPQMAAEMKSRNFHVGISLDGNKDTHNLQRPAKNSQMNSYQMVYSGVENLVNAGYSDIGVIGTITKLNINDVLDIVDTYVNEFNFHSFKMNLVKTNPFAEESKDISIIDIDEIDLFYERLLQKLISCNDQGYFIFERNIADKIQNLLTCNQNNICLAHGCLGGNKMISFNSKGEIFPCELVDVESVKMGTIYDARSCNDLIEDSKSSNPFFKSKLVDKCSACLWKNFCGGGCSASVIYTDYQSAYDELECKINQVLYPKLIDIIINRPDMVWYLSNKTVKVQ